jgi:hypothetical protein
MGADLGAVIGLARPVCAAIRPYEAGKPAGGALAQAGVQADVIVGGGAVEGTAGGELGQGVARLVSIVENLTVNGVAVITGLGGRGLEEGGEGEEDKGEHCERLTGNEQAFFFPSKILEQRRPRVETF